MCQQGRAQVFIDYGFNAVQMAGFVVDKFFPTVALVESPLGPVVHATYLTDLSSGVTDTQLRLHLDTALSSCTQALSRVGPLLPEM